MSNKKPNVILIYADDLGYGDISCYGATEIETPNVDSLLCDGIRFDNAYSTSAVCTPARYSLFTGEYPFRKDKETHILKGDAPCIISKEQMTLPKVFQQAGYQTASIGKWHLGLGNNDLDWNKPISHTPNDVGFDYSFIFPATNDRTPCVFLENRDVVNLDPNDPIEVSYDTVCPFDDIPTYEKNPEMLRFTSSYGHCNSIVNGVGRIGFMRGGKKATWRDEDLAESFLEKTKSFIDRNLNNPFFVYYGLHQPHVPRVPNEKFAGKSSLGARGDVILELDWCVGELKKHLEKQGLLEDTIIIFSSDNGPVLNDGYDDFAFEKNNEHRPAGPLRGGKYSKFDGGARIPFIVSWKGNIKKATSMELFSQVDLTASFASMLNINLNEGEAIDSQDMHKLLTGECDQGRDELMYESIQKAHVLRKGRWSYLAPSAGEFMNYKSHTELGNSLDDQLYNMTYDIGQKNNVSKRYNDILGDMKTSLSSIENS